MPIIDGQPIWFELTTTDQEAAAAFYERVIGWTTIVSPLPEHGGYGIASAPDGEGVAGMMTPPVAPVIPGWAIYFGVTALAATLARVTELGGSVVFGPMAIPHVGDFAVVRDPQGIAACVMQPAGDSDAAPFKQGPDALGHAVWIELATPDPDAAFAFHGALFGWTRAGAMPMGDMGDYAFIGAGEAQVGAIMSSAATGAPPRWNCYFAVADIDAAVAAAQDGGGALIQGPDPIPGGDYSVNIADPHGNTVGLVGPRKESAQ